MNQPILKICYIALFFCKIVSAQQSDTISLNSEQLKKIIQEEVQKEVTKQKEELSKENLKFFDRARLSGSALIRIGEWDSKQTDIDKYTGEVKILDDRFWARFNFVLNFDFKLLDNVDLHSRIRTGHKQYSFVTFGENLDERFNIILDQFWLNYKYKNFEFRVGRQDAGRIWSNQKGAQFDIPMHDGFTTTANFKYKNLYISPKLAFFIENYKNNAPLEEQGKIFGFSLKVGENKENINWSLESGLLKADNLPTRYVNDIAQSNNGVKYHDGDLASDYAIWTNQLALSFKKIRNLTFTIDYYNNLKNYKINPISHAIYDVNGNSSFLNPTEHSTIKSPNFTNQRNGFIATASIGDLSKPKNLFLGLSYLYMEKYAAMDYFAQYDFARWASTNIKGPEFIAGYRFNKYFQLRSRIFITKEIKGLYGINPNYKKSEDRFRIDFNINF